MSSHNSGIMTIKLVERSYGAEWSIHNFTATMSSNGIVTSPSFLYRNKLWHVVIKSEPHFIGGRFGFCRKYLYGSGSSYFVLRLRDEKGIEMSASGNENNACIFKFALFGPKDILHIFKERDGNLVVKQNKFTCTYETVTIVGLFPDNDQPEKSLAPTFFRAGICKGNRFIELSQDFKEAYLNKINCDLKIQVKEQTFEVHKMILAARSPVFATMIKDDMLESKNNVVHITDCDPEAFEVFLLYLYSGETENMSIENVLHVFFIADKYNVGKLKVESVEYMKNNLCVDKFYDIIELAVNHKESELLKALKEYFRSNSKEIVSSVRWQSFIEENAAFVNEFMLLLTY